MSTHQIYFLNSRLATCCVVASIFNIWLLLNLLSGAWRVDWAAPGAACEEPAAEKSCIQVEYTPICVCARALVHHSHVPFTPGNFQLFLNVLVELQANSVKKSWDGSFWKTSNITHFAKILKFKGTVCPQKQMWLLCIHPVADARQRKWL